MSRRALVTGVGGFTGRRLAERLLADGWDVSGTVHSRPSGIEGVQEHRCDVADWAEVRRVVAESRPDVVFHLAAIVDTVTTPDLSALYRTNTLGTAAVLDAVGKAGDVARVVLASSAFAYGRFDGPGAVVGEDTPLAPVTPYGASKAAAEVIALQWSRQHATDVVVARGFQHTGPGHVGRYALADWARQLAEGADRLEVGDLSPVRDYLDVRDVAGAYVALAESGRAGRAYNVASGIPRSMRDMLDGLVTAFGREVEVAVAPDRLRAVDQPVFVADVERLHEDTGWVPAYGVEETLRDLADFATESARAAGEDDARSAGFTPFERRTRG
ncbi:NAD-dependent epimerase/dehydratase family protein [Intrasporangium flavum]|uniref:NAD-dependent epimerase/dehydratase family protein n=1 Tax=Intrasporangium flavum TaxID=1428657 RepID=UPI00096C724F|nr:NAD-dependent epimerase/dehydratase family protein [Intrasporangium flavum]